MTEAFRSFQPTEATVPLWTSLLERYEATDVQAALLDYLKVGKFAPVPADIISRIESIQKARVGSLSPDRLWRICFSVGSHTQPRGDLESRLIEAGVPTSQAGFCARVVRSLGVERMLHCDLESPEYSFMRKDFLRAIESESSHENTYKMAAALDTSPALKNLISSVKVIQ